MSVVRGLAAGNAAYVVQTVVRLFTTAIVARLISPEEMGIWTLGFALIGTFQILRDFGTATYIQTSNELSNEDIRICNGLQLVVGIFFFIVFLAAAQPVASFYNEPRVAEVIYVLALGFLIMPLSSTTFNLFVRDGRFALKSGIDFVSQMCMYAGGVLFAYLGASHLSAPIAVVIAQVLVVLICFFYRNKEYSLGYSFSNVSRVAKLSSTALSVSLLQHASDRSPDFVLPKAQGFAQSSMYEKGVNCLELVKLAVVELIGSVLVSSLRLRAAKDPSIFSSLASNTLSTMMLFAVLGASLLAVNGHEFLLTLFGAQWVEARHSLVILAFATPFVCMTAFLTKVMYLRDMHALALKTSVVTRVCVILIVLLFCRSSLTSLATAIVAAEITFALFYVYLNRNNLDLSAFLKPMLVDSIIIVSSVLAASAAVKVTGVNNHFASLLLNGLFSGAMVCIVIFATRKSTLHRLRFCLNL